MSTRRQNMQVLMLTTEYGKFHFSGLGTHVNSLVPYLKRDSVDITICTYESSNNSNSDYYGEDVIKIKPIALPIPDYMYGLLQFNIELGIEAYKLIRELDIQLIHCQDWFLGISALKLHKFLKIPLITTIHQTVWNQNGGMPKPREKYMHEVQGKLIQESDRIICCSESMVDEVENLWPKSINKLVYIPNGIDWIKFNDNRGKTKQGLASDDEIVILFVGRLVSYKGVEETISAFRNIQREFSNTSLKIIGTGPLKAWLKKQIEYIPQITYVEFLEQEKLINEYHNADIIVVPSHYEPFGLVALEAMACGKPVVATDVGGLRELIKHNVTGMLIPPKSNLNLINALKKLILEPDLRKTLGDNALNSSKKWDWKSIASQTKELYKIILDGN